jgi:hypothetical protein
VRPARPRTFGVLALAAVIVAGPAAGLAAADTLGDTLPDLTLSCTLPVSGLVGQPVEMSPLAVVDDVVAALDSVGGLPLGTDLATRLQFGALAPFQVGRITDEDVVITGDRIADAVVGQLPHVTALDPLRPTVVDAVRHSVASRCGQTVHTLDLARTQSAGEPVTQGDPLLRAADPVGTTGTPLEADAPVGGLGAALPAALYQFGGPAGTVAPRAYGGIPFAAPGVFAQAPAARYGRRPRSVPVDSVGDREADDPLTAGSAVALGAGLAAGGIGLPTLVAVLALSGVTGALVRTWALRRGPA